MEHETTDDMYVLSNMEIFHGHVTYSVLRVLVALLRERSLQVRGPISLWVLLSDSQG